MPGMETCVCVGGWVRAPGLYPDILKDNKWQAESLSEILTILTILTNSLEFGPARK